jgi:hypothetical protein
LTFSMSLKHTLIEESVVVAMVCFVFLLHFLSALVAILMLPVGILMSFAAMKAIGLGSNIMSLGGIAIAVGAMIDAAIVMIENAHKRLERAQPGTPRLKILIDAASEVGPALFFSLLVITASFLPIFTLEAQEGDHRTPAKPLDFVNPGRVHVPRPGATLSADDRPMDIGQVRLCDRADERLERDEAHGSRHLSQFVQSAENLRILDGRTEPNIGKDLEFRSGQDLSHPIGPLRQNLIGVLGCLLHHLPDTRDELGRHLFMKKVRHGIYKDEPRLRLGRRNFERFWIEADLARPHRAVAAPARKAAILRLPHGIEPSRHPHGIAVGAAGGEHGATRDGIPGRVRPFDCGVGHVEPRSSTAIARFALARPVRRAQRARFCGRSPGAHDTFVPEMKYVAHSLFGLCSAANRWCAFIDARSKRSPPEIAV